MNFIEFFQHFVLRGAGLNGRFYYFFQLFDFSIRFILEGVYMVDFEFFRLSFFLTWREGLNGRF